MTDMTAIVPIDLSQRPMDIIQKALRLASAAEIANVRIVFGHNDTRSLPDKLFKILLRKYKKTSVVSGHYYTEHVNSSLLRNRAFEDVSTPYLILLDVDIWPDFEILKKYRDRLKEVGASYYFLPCLYLTASGSRSLTSKKLTTQELKARFFNFSRKEFLHLASPSSVTVMRSTDYRLLGGFDEGYTGHGYEDFDFLIRLAVHHKRLQPREDTLADRPARSPLFAVGFRKYLGEQCLDALLEKDFVYHIFHKKPKTSRYYSARPSNYVRFAEQHATLVCTDTAGDKSLITQFTEACALSNLDVSEYSILFDNKPGHIDRFDTFKRRLRFLLND